MYQLVQQFLQTSVPCRVHCVTVSPSVQDGVRYLLRRGCCVPGLTDWYVPYGTVQCHCKLKLHVQIGKEGIAK